MKKLILAFLLLPSFAIAAPVTTEWIAPGSGINDSSIFNSPGTQWNRQTLGLIFAALQKNIPGGVAGVDTNGRVTAPSQTTSVTVGPTVSGAVIPQTYTYINPQTVANDAGPFYWWDGNSTMRIGGAPIALPHNPYASAQGVPQAGTSQNIVLSYAPNGGYDAGCAMCVFMDPSSIKQASISAVQVQKGAIPTADGVAYYANVPDAQFSLIVPVASYTPTSVVLSDALTPAELSQIQPFMTIFTNSQIPGVTASAPEDDDYYMGVVKSVSTTNGVTTITVYGWGQETGVSAGDTPSTTSLETYFWANRTTPVVGIGGFNKAFGGNVFLTYDGSKAGGTGGAATSIVHSYTRDETDFDIVNETRAGSVKFAGYGIQLSMDPNHTNVLTHDSLGFLAGGNLPAHFKSADSCYLDGSGFYDQAAFLGAASWLGGACQLGALETALGRYDQEVAEFDGRTNASADWRLMYHVAEAVQGQGAAPTNVLPKLGVVLGGDQGTGIGAGSPQADIEWNWNSLYGGMALCGNNGGTFNCGVAVDSNGVAHLNPNTIKSGNGTIIGVQPAGHVAGFGQYYDASYGSYLMEVLKGSTNEFSLGPNGDASFNGGVTTGSDVTAGGNVTAGAGKQFYIPGVSGVGAGIGVTLTTDGTAGLTVGAANGGTSSLNVGNIRASGYVTSTGLLTASNNFAMRGIQYYQDTDAVNAVQAYVGTDDVLTWSAVVSGAKMIMALPVSVTSPLTVSNDATFTNLAGTGNAYACLDQAGKLYRSASACN